jgi:Animal haem peroxidase
MPGGLSSVVLGCSVVLRLGIYFALVFIVVACASNSKEPETTSEIESQFYTFLEPRTLDGSNNNPFKRDLGKAGTPYLRLTKANYANGTSDMVIGPEPRYVSNRIFNDSAQNLFSENGVTQWIVYWGQFLDHTFGLRAEGAERIPLMFDADDPLENFQNDLGILPFARSAVAPGSGPREQRNTVSSYIDAWAVYGGTTQRLEWLREGQVDGNLYNNSAKLLMTIDSYLPRATERGDASSAPVMDLVGRLITAPEKRTIAGDVRANENIGLTAVHTLFVREHNRIVAALPKYLPEEIKFQIARRVVGAEQQYITYNEFLPALGITLSSYRNYNPKVNPSLSNEFATVGYRAHSMIHGEFEIETEASRYTPEVLSALEQNGVEVERLGDEIGLAVPLNIAFANPELVPQLGLGPLLVGLASEAQYNNDEQIDNQLRSVLFQIPKPGIDPSECLDGPVLESCFSGVLDIGALDIARGRDHGMPFYNDLRAAYGLPRVTSFAQLTGEDSEVFPNDPTIDSTNPLNDPDILIFDKLLGANGNTLTPGSVAADAEAIIGIRRTTLAARLKAIYGDINRVDAFVGMMAEPHIKGSEFGELQRAIWKKQFEALRDGDRFFYARDGALPWIKRQFGIDYRHTLADIIRLNTDIAADDIQDNAFKVRQ